MSLASRLCITLVFWQLGVINAGEVQCGGNAECATSKETPHVDTVGDIGGGIGDTVGGIGEDRIETVDDVSSLLQVKSSIKKKKWGWVSNVVNHVGGGISHAVDHVVDAVVDVVEDVAEEAVSVAEDVIEDIGDAAESVVGDLHDNIVEGFGDLHNFLSKHVDVSWKMLENIFGCLVDFISEYTDCASVWARQVTECVAGRGCAISIGYPTCSSLSTTGVFTTQFLQINETDAPAHFDAEFEAVDRSVYQPATHVLSSHALRDPVNLDVEHMESGYLSTSGIDPSAGPSEEDAVSEIQLLQDFNENSSVMVVNWTDHSLSQLQAHSMPSIQTTGQASVGAGGWAHVNMDTGTVNFKSQVELDLEVKVTVGVSHAASRDTPKRYIVNPRRLLTKLIMVGKFPVKLDLKVALVQQAGLSADGSFGFDLLLKQRVNLNFDVDFNVQHLDRTPTVSISSSNWDPDNSLTWNGHGQMNAWFQVAPELHLTINEVPLKEVWGPKWLAVADVQADSSGCSKAEFALDTTLSGRFDISLPGLAMGSIINSNCNLFADLVAGSPGGVAAACVAKSAFNFDPVQATRDACDSVLSVIPDFDGHTFWSAELFPSRLTLVDFDSSHMCSSSPSSPQQCKHIEIVTASWGSENSWTLGTCSGPFGGPYSDDRDYDFGSCCLSGSQTLTCQDSYGDGWHGGYLKIDGVKYCEDFAEGNSKTETVGFTQQCKHIKLVTTSWGSENSWTLGTCGGGDYSDNRQYDEGSCCLSGSQILTCQDSFGDGWHGGYLEIDGVKYCQDFAEGNSKTETVVFS